MSPCNDGYNSFRTWNINECKGTILKWVTPNNLWVHKPDLLASLFNWSLGLQKTNKIISHKCIWFRIEKKRETEVGSYLFWNLQSNKLSYTSSSLQQSNDRNKKQHTISQHNGGKFRVKAWLIDLVRVHEHSSEHFEYNLEFWLTSPAPRNRKVWSANVPPTSLRAASSPATTTDAVP